MAMPPRKKQKTLASSFAAGSQQGAGSLPATSMAAVGPLQRDVALCVELMYDLRHGTESDLPSKRTLDDPLVGVGSSGHPQVEEDGLYPFPLLHGGTFMEIAQRAQARPPEDASWLLKESAAMCAAAGLISAPDPVEFQAAYVSTEDICQHLQKVHFRMGWFSFEVMMVDIVLVCVPNSALCNVCWFAPPNGVLFVL